ncbi:hypothetical protein ALC53_00926 [Atta colombica]|uniref:Uncharacterized protein n=1 Tax=Atta colombica TaxID=520822 RepID=A0A195BWY3_9HYME|nr:hypothetical protein ALC53_00926 [Atta colombica]
MAADRSKRANDQQHDHQETCNRQARWSRNKLRYEMTSIEKDGSLAGRSADKPRFPLLRWEGGMSPI